MTLKSDARFEEKLICDFKNDKNLVNFEPMTWALKILKSSTLTGSFSAKYITFDPKNHREVIFHDTAERCKILRKTDSPFRKGHEEDLKSSPDDLKNIK